LGKLVAIEHPPRTICTSEWTEYLLTQKRLNAILKLRSALSERLDRLNEQVAELEEEVGRARERIIQTLERGGEIEKNARVSLADVVQG
jgi:hypothetical protein